MVKGLFKRLFAVLSSGRSLLAAAGISAGIFAIVIVSVLSETGARKISESAAEMGINSVMVQTEITAEGYLSDEDIAVLSEIKGVEKATPLLSGYSESLIIGKDENVMIWGVNEDAKDIISLSARHGRLISRNDVNGRKKVCVIDSELAESSYGRSNIVGKPVKLYLGGKYHIFTVIGVAKSGVTSLQNSLSGIIPRFAYIPYTTMQDITGRSGYDKIAVLTEPDADSKEITARINTTIKENHKGADGISVNNLQQHKSQINDITSVVKLVLSLVAGVSLLVSGLNVMTTVMSGVNERRREIGIKKAIGAKNSTIVLEFLGEGIVITSFGAVFGTVMGLLVCGITCKFVGIAMAVDFPLVLVAVSAAVLIGAVFSVYPAIKAAKMYPIDALRS